MSVNSLQKNTLKRNNQKQLETTMIIEIQIQLADLMALEMLLFNLNNKIFVKKALNNKLELNIAPN